MKPALLGGGVLRLIKSAVGTWQESKQVFYGRNAGGGLTEQSE
jgi:hypothetical protein